MRDSTCHRCGARARRGPSSRAICARCAAEPFRGSVPELDELAGKDAPIDERISLELIHSVDTGLVAPILDRSRRSIPWRSLAPVLLLGITLGALGTATVGEVVARDDKPPVAIVLDAKTASAVQPPSEPAEATEPSGVVATPEPEETPTTEPEAAAPSPAPATRQRTATASTSRPATTSPPARQAPAPATRPSTAPPTRDAVRQAFLAVRDDVQQCGDVEQIGSVVVARVVFSADTGRVLHAQVTDASVAPEIRSCVARVARGAQLSPFGGQDTLTVTYPFTL